MIVLAKILVALFFLVCACRHDLRDRIIPNKLWKIMLLALIPLTIAEFAAYGYGWRGAVHAAVQFLIVFAVVYLLHQLGVFGGADAKALLVLSAAFPIYPVVHPLPILNKGFSILALTTLSNSAVLVPGLLIYNFLANVKSIGFSEFRKSAAYYFIGRKVNIDSIPRFYALLEYSDGKSTKLLKRGIDTTAEHIQNLKKAGKTHVWATQELPYIVFITVGFVMSVVVGDIIYELVLYS